MAKSKLKKRYDELNVKLDKYLPKADSKKICKAWEFAKTAHTGQKRLTGDPYVLHSLETAINLAEWKVDEISVIAALLHDTVDDGAASKKDLEGEFGEEIAGLVDGVSKVSELRLKGSTESDFLENLRKLILVMAEDLRVVLIKLADRLHNMQTLNALPEDKQVKIARETLEIYAPLAERLGIGEVKGKLEDLAFPYVYPKKYKKVISESKKYYEKAEEVTSKMKNKLLKDLESEGIKAEIHARRKKYYSLWRKLERENIDWDFDKIHDIVALRIVTPKESECYVALGIVHKNYKPVPHLGVSDFIAQPKPNGYQSIHTKVFGPEGKPAEVQIRTHDMHEHAEYGFAAHWVYSEAKKKGIKDEVLESGYIPDKSKIEWVKQLIKWQKQIEDKKEFEEAVKFDALAHRIFVFSPKGDVFDLPAEATPVDFAFAVHTEMGKYIKGAKVNGKIVSLDHKLKSGDMVEILKNKKPKPTNRAWLGFVKTHTARRGIKKYMKK